MGKGLQMCCNKCACSGCNAPIVSVMAGDVCLVDPCATCLVNQHNEGQRKGWDKAIQAWIEVNPPK
jgi:hypothetical protein